MRAILTALAKILGYGGVVVLLCWIFSPANWVQWSAVCLQLLGLSTAILGIIQTSYGVDVFRLGRRLYLRIRSKFTPPIYRAGNMEARASSRFAAQGPLGVSIHRNLHERVDELEKRLNEVKAGLEDAMRRLGEKLHRDDAAIEARQQEGLKRLRDETLQKHGLEIRGIAWLAVGILMSGPWTL